MDDAETADKMKGDILLDLEQFHQKVITVADAGVKALVISLLCVITYDILLSRKPNCLLHLSFSSSSG